MSVTVPISNNDGDTTTTITKPEHVDEQLRNYLVERGLLKPNEPTSWRIELSKLSGRGVVAQRTIKRDELVYADQPLITGPRCYDKYLPMCSVCYKRDRALFGCDRGCGLPLCSDSCQNDATLHLPLCSYLIALRPIIVNKNNNNNNDWSLDILRSLVPLKAALITPNDHRKLWHSLQSNRNEARELTSLKKSLTREISYDDEIFMRLVCNVMDTNAYETALLINDTSTIVSLRSLFPLGALTNHQCAPNTRHLIDNDGVLNVYATRDIDVGEEITMAYTELLWDTTMRRQFLRITKQFSCDCARCDDVTEFGSYLGALNCASNDCTGRLLPVEPLNFNTIWKCDECEIVIKNRQIMYIRAGILAATEESIYETPRKISRFVSRELSVLVPRFNYFMLDGMFRIVSLYGRVDGCRWTDLTDDELDLKVEYCEYLIKALDQLRCGDCMKKGLLLYELYCTNDEKIKRSSHNDADKDVAVSENDRILNKAMKILKNDIAAPNDYRELYAIRSST